MSDYELAAMVISTAVSVVLLIYGWLIQQAFRVRRFYRDHAKTVWQPAERIRSYKQMDDPVLRLIYRCCCMEPAMRLKGEYAPPEPVLAEPGRTERALQRSEWFGLKHALTSACRRKPQEHGSSSNDKGKVAVGNSNATMEVWSLDAKPFVELAAGNQSGSSHQQSGAGERRKKPRQKTHRKPPARVQRFEKMQRESSVLRLQSVHRGNKARAFVEELRFAYAESNDIQGAMRELKEAFAINVERPPSFDQEEAMEAASQFEELSIWLEHGCGGSLQGTFWSLGITALQLLMAFAISIYSVLAQEVEWAARTSLTIMVIVQVIMAVWSVGADPIDRLEGLVGSFVSVLEGSATSLLLASSYMREAEDANEATLELMGILASRLLMASVFVPIGLSVYDNILLPTADAMQQRIQSGQSCGRAACGILTQIIILPMTIMTAMIGMSFRAGDVLQAVADDSQGTVADGKAVAQETRPRGEHRDKRNHENVEALHMWEEEEEQTTITTMVTTTTMIANHKKDCSSELPSPQYPPPPTGVPVASNISIRKKTLTIMDIEEPEMDETARDTQSANTSAWSSNLWGFLTPEREDGDQSGRRELTA